MGSPFSTFSQDILRMRKEPQCHQQFRFRDLQRRATNPPTKGCPEDGEGPQVSERNKGAFGRARDFAAEKKKRERVAEVISWLEFAEFSGARKRPQWLVADKAWKEWKEGYAKVPGISEGERKKREWVVNYAEGHETRLVIK